MLLAQMKRIGTYRYVILINEEKKTRHENVKISAQINKHRENSDMVENRDILISFLPCKNKI